MTAPGPSAAAVLAAETAIHARMVRRGAVGCGDLAEAGLTAALPLLRAEWAKALEQQEAEVADRPALRALVRAETIRECVALADALKDTYRKVQGHDPQSAAYHDGKVHAAEYLADALCALLPITALCALLPITEEGTDE